MSIALVAGGSSSAKYVTTAIDGGLSNEIVRPELGDYNGGTPTDVDISAGTAGTGVTFADLGDSLLSVSFTDNTWQQLDTAVAIGTGNFDVRMRVISSEYSDVNAASASVSPDAGFGLTDSSRTAATRVMLVGGTGGKNATPGFAGFLLNASTVGAFALLAPAVPPIYRIARSGTTITGYVSITNGKTWIKLGATTASTDFQKIGAYVNRNSANAVTGVLVYDWLRYGF